MGVVDFIRAKKEAFSKAQMQVREKRLLSSVEERLKAEERRKYESAIRENKAFVQQERKEHFNNSFLGQLGSKARVALDNKSKAKVKTGKKIKVNFGSSKASDVPYYAKTNNNNNIYNSPSNSSPFSLSDNRNIYFGGSLKKKK